MVKQQPFYRLVNFIRRFGILHIVFWIWTYMDLIHLLGKNTSGEHIIYSATVIKVFEIICVYFVVGFLMPRFLNKGKRLQFILLVIATICSTAFLQIAFDTEGAHSSGSHSSLLARYLSNVTDLVIFTAVFFAIYTVDNLQQAEKRNNRLDRERLTNELNFLKAQLNPHFLFNAINSIYVLIEEDKKLASETLLKFSGLLRYQLYDCTTDRTLLDRELAFLKDYIDLERMRNGNELAIRYEADQVNNHDTIAPFVLMTFVENAFKHKSHHKDRENYVSVKAAVRNHMLYFSVENTCDDRELSATGKTEGGIGLQNVQRRLDLLYPESYKLQVSKGEALYSVNLELKLDENQMHYSR